MIVLQSVLQDISSHQRLVDSVVEKAQGVLQSTSNSDVASFITSISSRYEKLASDAKVYTHSFSFDNVDLVIKITVAITSSSLLDKKNYQPKQGSKEANLKQNEAQSTCAESTRKGVN